MKRTDLKYREIGNVGDIWKSHRKKRDRLYEEYIESSRLETNNQNIHTGHAKSKLIF